MAFSGIPKDLDDFTKTSKDVYRLAREKAERAFKKTANALREKDLDSIDPSEREELWERIDKRIEKEGGTPSTRQKNLVELSEDVGRMMAKKQNEMLRNLGHPNGVARKMFEDRRTEKAAQSETAPTNVVMKQVKAYRRMRTWINNLILNNPRVGAAAKAKWKPKRDEASKQEKYWMSVLTYRNRSYKKLLKMMRGR